jgi:hypothetical protein
MDIRVSKTVVRNISLAQETIRAFIIKFNKKSVFQDESVHCVDLLTCSNIKKYLPTGMDDIEKLTYTEACELFHLIYLELIKTIPEKKNLGVFAYITQVYRELFEVIKIANS